MRFLTFTDAFGSSRRFCRVVTCYDWTSSDAVVSLSFLKICLTIIVLRFYINVMKLHEQSHPSQLASRFKSEKWPRGSKSSSKLPVRYSTSSLLRDGKSKMGQSSSIPL